MKYREFSDLGWKVSEIGIGCWAIGSEWGDVSVEDAKEALYASIDNGINFFDTADVAVSYSLTAIFVFSVLCVSVISLIFKTGYRLKN